MADERSAVDETRTFNPNTHQSPIPATTLSRHDSESSTGSEGYSPLPQGKWCVPVHGSCPKCHHQHTAVEVRVNTTRSGGKGSRVRCDSCKNRWLIFGGSNSTQISLLSTTSIQPDPVENEVRLALVSMIKSATAFASPTLARIPETTQHNAAGEPSTSPGARSLPGSQASASSERQPSQASASLNQNRALRPALATPSPRPINEDKHPGRSRAAFSKIKFRVTAGIQNFKWRLNFATLKFKKTQPSANVLGKLPVDDPAPETSQTQAPRPVDLASRKEQLDHHAVEPSPVILPAAGEPAQNPEVARFIAPLREEILNLENGAHISWAREKYTQFKTKRAPTMLVDDTSPIDSRTRDPHFESLETPLTLSPRSLEFFGLGGPNNVMDTIDWLGNRPQVTPSEGGTSESMTAVEDSTGARLQRLSALLSERSQRPLSANSLMQAWAQLRHPGLEARRSFDSTATGGPVRSTSTPRGRTHRRSRGSLGRGSASGLREMSMSQTSLPAPTNEEDVTNENHDDPTSSPPATPSHSRHPSA